MGAVQARSQVLRFRGGNIFVFVIGLKKLFWVQTIWGSLLRNPPVATGVVSCRSRRTSGAAWMSGLRLRSA